MGSEKVIINVKTNARDEVTEYIMRIWKVGNRHKQNKQAYTLGLVSEAINNETVRMSAPLVGNPESIAIKLVNELGSTKTIFSENSLFEVKYLPNRERPFDIIAKLAGKAVSPQAKYTTETDIVKTRMIKRELLSTKIIKRLVVKVEGKWWIFLLGDQ